MTGPEARQIGLARALQEVDAIILGWRHRDEDPADLTDLANP